VAKRGHDTTRHTCFYVGTESLEEN
jgi:hypothetical protein